MGYSMTPHSTIEDDHDGDNRGKGQMDEEDGSSTSVIYQLKEKEQEVMTMTQRLNAVNADLEIKKLELRCQEQRYKDKEYECEKIKEIRDKMMENKDRELQDAKTLADDLQHRVNLLNKLLEDSLHHSSKEFEETGSDNEDIHPVQSHIPLFSQEERIIKPPNIEAEGSDVICPFCLSSTIDAQNLPFHLSNCPDSLKWHGQDTNHSDHYQRMIQCK